MRKSIVALASALVMLLPFAGAATASTPKDVTIVVQLSTIEWWGPFEASGPAVEAGIMCSEGISASLFNRPSATGPRWPDGFFTVGVYKIFFCDGDDPEVDAFVARLPARAWPGEGTIFTWAVIDGWGRFETLRGAGTGTGAYGQDLIVDSYTGRMHLN